MIYDLPFSEYSTQSSFLLGKWIEDARSLGTDEASKNYYEENARTLAQRRALLEKRFADFAALVLESGRASFALCQNVYCATDVRHQGLSVALALSQSILQGSSGAWRMQGGGFAGTIQAYVPETLLQRYHTAMERVFGPGSCYVLRLREQGARQVL